MSTPIITTCKQCSEIPNLISIIDCKIAMEANKLYQNIVLMLNLPVDDCLIEELIHYKRILTYKSCEDGYAENFSIERITNQIMAKTIGCGRCCDNNTTTSTTTAYVIPTTTTTSSTEEPTTTTTTSSSSSSSTTTTTSSSSSSSTTTTTTTIVDAVPCNTTSSSGEAA